LLVATLSYPLFMFYEPWNLGVLDWGPVQSAYLGMLLFAAASVSIGLLVSSVTDSQAVAFFITFFVLLLAWYVGRAADWMGGPLGEALRYVSFENRMEGFMRGLIAVRDVVYFLSIAAICLIAAFRKLESRKWS
jgi:ABC-2 type transport system permease protein